jgi:hypothetical protein
MNDQESFPFMDAPIPRRRRQPRAVARRNDPDTSWQAADSFSPEELNQLQAKVLAYFRRVRRSTDEEMRNAFGEDSCYTSRRYAYSTLMTRRKELERLGFIRDSGQRVLNSRGRPVIVWEIVD